MKGKYSFKDDLIENKKLLCCLSEHCITVDILSNPQKAPTFYFSYIKTYIRKSSFPFLNQDLFDLRNIYVVNLKAGRPKKNAL